LGFGEDAFREDFFFNSLFRRNPQDKLSLVDEVKVAYKHEWFTGFSNTFGFSNRRLYAIGDSGIRLYVNELDKYLNFKRLTTTEFTLDLHYGYREKVLAGEFERIVVSSPYPVLDLQFGYGIKDVFNSDYNYYRARVRISQWFNSMTAGWSKYVLEAGKIWGRVPYPLMKIHTGNETFWYDETAFNLMNYHEFVSDEYATFLFIHHFEGFFLNRIPAIRKLKWREVALIRGAVGHTSLENLQFNQFKQGTYSLGKPYFETGLGVENIFRFFRVDATWRLSYNDHPNTNRFGVLVSMNFNF